MNASEITEKAWWWERIVSRALLRPVHTKLDAILAGQTRLEKLMAETKQQQLDEFKALAAQLDDLDDKVVAVFDAQRSQIATLTQQLADAQAALAAAAIADPTAADAISSAQATVSKLAALIPPPAE